MEILSATYEYLLSEFGAIGISIAFIAVVMFIVQLRYHFIYGRIASYRESKSTDSEETIPVSVIIPFYVEDFDYLQTTLMELLNQTLEHYEIVLVDVTGNEDFSERLKAMSMVYARLRTTRMARDERFHINGKMALNVGIKAARYDHVIISSPDCRPASKRWLELMSRGFAGADVVIGYCGLDVKGGLSAGLMRCSRVAVSMRWLGSAIRRRPYRGTINNLGFSKSVYFDARGFNFLNLDIGEDDLFVMKIAGGDNTAVAVSGAASVRERAAGGMEWWHTQRCNLSFTYRHYPLWVKRFVGTELWSRFIFFVSAIALIVAMPLYGKLFGVALLVLRFAFVMFETSRVCRRLSERGILSIYLLYDLLSPFFEAELAVSRRFKSSNEVWR